MSNPGDADDTPIASVKQLADHIAAGCKPRSEYRIGTEHEKFGFMADLRPPPYAPDGIEALLQGLQSPGLWEPILDRGKLIGLKGQGANRSASISLEPAGQLELSGGMLSTLHDTAAELQAHFDAVRPIADALGLGFSPLGHHPTMPRDAMPWMPKSRYAIMRRYMPLVGTRGLDMMTRTCTVQVNLDYSSEADMARKLRVAMALQPVATALFANSPFVEGRPSGFLSSRAQVWTDVDNQRSGMPPVFFEEDFGFERYVEWLLDVPMYFIVRDGQLIDMAGQSFRRFMLAGRNTHPAVQATVGDFDDHMTTAFTDVRVKRFLEMRGADAGRPEMMVAQSAFWVGLLYDDAALAAADALVRRRPWAEYAAARAQVPRLALDTPFAGGTLRDRARDAVDIAGAGLQARGLTDAAGQDERCRIEPLLALVAGGPTQAELWLERYETVWDRDATKIFAESRV
jgi:glutamate--cysteine ligase